MRKAFILVLFSLLVFLSLKPSFATEGSLCVVYFTGIGCPHCAKTDPVILQELPQKYPNLVIIEYEIYQQTKNALILDSYCQAYNLTRCYPGGPSQCCGIPLVIFGKDKIITGDAPILKGFEKILKEQETNPCPLMDGKSLDFKNLVLSSLPGEPKIWAREMRGTPVGKAQKPQIPRPEGLTLAKVLSLAAADSVNPCALAVLTLMLIAILTYNPEKKHKVLLAGLAFSFSVFVMYLFYGLVIIRFFQLIQALTNIRLWLYKVLGVAAIILGVLNIKDFLRYKPGGFLTEMPMFLRPKMQNLFFGLTTPKGAFGVGAFVTVFLLPCTIGPYIICGGILCPLSLLEAFPWLLFYNLIFVLPMLAITLACYIGFTNVENISGWRERNIKFLHLFAGLIIFALGLAMIFGWV